MLPHGTPVLRKKCTPVETINDETRALIQDMFETMYDAPGVGLAANQIGIDLSLAVIDLHLEGKKDPLVLINPKILELKGQLFEEEGCLSIPGLGARVKRAAYAKVSALDEQGEPFIVEGEGYLARALQHEIDHLNGKFYIDHLSMLDRIAMNAEIKSRKREGKF